MMMSLLALALGTGAMASDYEIGPGDTLDIQVYGEADLSGTVVVSEACTVTLALVERIDVCGLTADQVEASVTQAYSGDYLLNPSVKVRVTEFLSQRVDVLGEVGKPGPQYLRGATSMLEVISLAGGALDTALWVVVVHAEGETERFPIDAVSAGEVPMVGGGDKVFLESGGVIYVEGQIRKPGAVPLTDGLTVTQALALAGGPDEFASVRHVLVRRSTGEKLRVNVVRVNRGKDEDPILAEDDYVVVPRNAF